MDALHISLEAGSRKEACVSQAWVQGADKPTLLQFTSYHSLILF